MKCYRNKKWGTGKVYCICFKCTYVGTCTLTFVAMTSAMSHSWELDFWINKGLIKKHQWHQLT